MLLTVAQAEQLGGFGVIYADPPWRYADKGCNGAAAKHYATMTLADVCALPVPRVAAQDAVLFLWATYPMLREALQVIDAWGFTYRSIAFQWVKTYASGKPFFGLGRWTRGNSEPCLLATRGKPQRVGKGVSQLVITEELVVTQIGEHSAKPPEVRQRIEQLMGPEVASLELFARARAPNWDAWGLEVESTVTL